MANESVVYGIDGTFSAVDSDVKVSVVTTGGTLTGSNDIELRILKATFLEADNAGFNTKIHALNLLKAIEAAIVKNNWPQGGAV